MFYLFLRSKPGDTFIQSCKKLPDCQKAVEEVAEQLRQTYGTRKANFYVLDHTGEKVAGWVIHSEED